VTALRGIGAVAAVLLAVVACATPAHLRPIPPRGPIPADSRITVETAPVPLDPADPARREIDGFRYAGGLALTSSATSRLHGLSDLWVAPDGAFISPTDDGDIVTGRILLGPDERLTGIGEAVLKPLLGADGQPLQGKREGDAEGLTRLADGRLLISFERDHRIWVYDEAGRPTPAKAPPVALGENDGMEGLVAAPASGGLYFVGLEPGGIWMCRLYTGCDELDGLPAPPPGYRLSALGLGPKGELLILHHSFIPAIGSRIILTIVGDPFFDRAVIGRLAMGPSTTVDNFEGVAVVPRADGSWRLYLLSDDNFNDKQRTILLAFDWTPPK
jgi:hypothetical protein